MIGTVTGVPSNDRNAIDTLSVDLPVERSSTARRAWARIVWTYVLKTDVEVKTASYVEAVRRSDVKNPSTEKFLEKCKDGKIGGPFTLTTEIKREQTDSTGSSASSGH